MATNPTLSRLRRNKDGSYNAICPRCFATVARSKSEPEVAEHQRAHICESAFLAERGFLTRADSLSVLP
jgi:hypothetical protein